MQHKTLNETLDNFCDMSFLQAMDNIYATIYTIEYALSKSEINSKKKKIISYGNSHEAYLCHLCNAYSRLFTHMCDNSSWIYPKYILFDRWLNNKPIYSYLDSNIIDNNCNIIDIYWLYKNFDNNCYIESYYGVNDVFSTNEEKIKFKNIKNFNVIKIIEPDNEVFFSDYHELNANFIKCFDLFYRKINFDKNNIFNFPKEIVFKDKNSNITINYNNIYPEIYDLKSNT